ncbi:hypothetical protein ACJX0J_017475, partial [Zea mays]
FIDPIISIEILDAWIKCMWYIYLFAIWLEGIGSLDNPVVSEHIMIKPCFNPCHSIFGSKTKLQSYVYRLLLFRLSAGHFVVMLRTLAANNTRNTWKTNRQT